MGHLASRAGLPAEDVNAEVALGEPRFAIAPSGLISCLPPEIFCYVLLMQLGQNCCVSAPTLLARSNALPAVSLRGPWGPWPGVVRVSFGGRSAAFRRVPGPAQEARGLVRSNRGERAGGQAGERVGEYLGERVNERTRSGWTSE